MKVGDQLILAAKKQAEGQLEVHKANIEVLLTSPVGVGEHQDIQTAIEQELEELAQYHDKLEMLVKYFPTKEEEE